MIIIVLMSNTKCVNGMNKSIFVHETGRNKDKYIIQIM